jgi:hypothetical protein
MSPSGCSRSRSRRSSWRYCRRKAFSALLLAACGARAAAQSSVEAELRHDTQALLDAIAPGDTATWNRLLDSLATQVDENDVVRDKAEILANLQPLGPGLKGHLDIDDFRVTTAANMAVVTHEDNEYLDYHGQILRSRFRMTDTWVHSASGWRLFAEQVLAVPIDPPIEIRIEPRALCGYAGRYALTEEIVAEIRCDGDHLVVARQGRPDRTFRPESPDVFFEPGQPRTRRIFQRDEHGHIIGFVDRREGRDVAWKRIG